MSRIIVHPATSHDSGPDRRVRAEDRIHVTYSRSSWTHEGDNGGLLNSHVEVQSFISGGVPVTALVVSVTSGEHNYAGSTSLMLSGDEARAVAEALILAASEQDALRESNRAVAL